MPVHADGEGSMIKVPSLRSSMCSEYHTNEPDWLYGVCSQAAFLAPRRPWFKAGCEVFFRSLSLCYKFKRAKVKVDWYLGDALMKWHGLAT